MNNILEILESFINSNVERAKVRPFWEQNSKVLNAYVFWKKLRVPDIKNSDFELQIHKVYPQLKRLIRISDKKLIGYGFDEEFLIKELYELYSKKDGFIDLNGKINKIAHISDLHILWSASKTKEGYNIDDGILKRIVVSLKKENPDLVIVSGDITDDGLGYVKFYKAFEFFIKKGRLIVIPGNHDINPLGMSMLAGGFKESDYEEFARIVMGKRAYKDNFIFEFENVIVIGVNSSAGINKNITDNAVGYVEFKKINENLLKK